MTTQQINKAAAQKMKALPTAALVKLFNETETWTDDSAYTMRGWIMDELEARNPAAWDKYMDETATPAEMPLESYFA